MNKIPTFYIKAESSPGLVRCYLTCLTWILALRGSEPWLCLLLVWHVYLLKKVDACLHAVKELYLKRTASQLFTLCDRQLIKIGHVSVTPESSLPGHSFLLKTLHWVRTASRIKIRPFVLAPSHAAGVGSTFLREVGYRCVSPENSRLSSIPHCWISWGQTWPWIQQQHSSQP